MNKESNEVATSSGLRPRKAIDFPKNPRMAAAGYRLAATSGTFPKLQSGDSFRRARTSFGGPLQTEYFGQHVCKTCTQKALTLLLEYTPPPPHEVHAACF